MQQAAGDKQPLAKIISRNLRKRRQCMVVYCLLVASAIRSAAAVYSFCLTIFCGKTFQTVTQIAVQISAWGSKACNVKWKDCRLSFPPEFHAAGPSSWRPVRWQVYARLYCMQLSSKL